MSSDWYDHRREMWRPSDLHGEEVAMWRWMQGRKLGCYNQGLPETTGKWEKQGSLHQLTSFPCMPYATFCVLCCCFNTESYEVVKAGFKFVILLLQPAGVTGVSHHTWLFSSFSKWSSSHPQSQRVSGLALYHDDPQSRGLGWGLFGGALSLKSSSTNDTKLTAACAMY
jgi:hypothetical protein